MEIREKEKKKFWNLLYKNEEKFNFNNEIKVIEKNNYYWKKNNGKKLLLKFK